MRNGYKDNCPECRVEFDKTFRRVISEWEDELINGTGCDGEAVEAWRRSSLVVSDVNDPGPLAVRGRSLVSGPVEQNKESE